MLGVTVIVNDEIRALETDIVMKLSGLQVNTEEVWSHSKQQRVLSWLLTAHNSKHNWSEYSKGWAI